MVPALVLAGMFGVGQAHAADILVPEATPATLDDFALSFMLYDMVASNLRDRGIKVADGSDISDWAGSDAEACADNDACPANLWDRTDARVAVVLSVGQTAGEMTVVARVYQRDRAAPVKTIEESVPAGKEEGFADLIGSIAADALSAAALPLADLDDEDDLPPVPSSSTKSASGGSSGSSTKSSGSASKSSGSTSKSSDSTSKSSGSTSKSSGSTSKSSGSTSKSSGSTSKSSGSSSSASKTSGSTSKSSGSSSSASKSSGSTSKSSGSSSSASKSSGSSSAGSASGRSDGKLTARQEAERRKMGIPRKAYLRYKDSGDKREDWLVDQRVRAGTGHADALLGLGLGDVDRGYGVWVHLVNQDGVASIDDSSTWLGDGFGVGLYAVGGVGYSPTWFLDLSLNAGIQQGSKHLETGWECPDCNTDTRVIQTIYEPRVATSLIIEPQVRFWLAATGVVKPFVSLGGQARIYDGFDVPGTEVPWPDTSGGVGFGASGGLGVAFDVTKRASLLVHVPYTFTLLPQPTSHDSELIGNQPTPLTTWGGALRLAVGTSVRF